MQNHNMNVIGRIAPDIGQICLLLKLRTKYSWFGVDEPKPEETINQEKNRFLQPRKSL